MSVINFDTALSIRLQKISGMFFSVFLILCLGCATSPKIHSVVRELEQRYPNVQVGVSVVRVSDSKELYRHQAEKTFTPASTLKVITAASAMNYLKPDYRFQTKIYTNSRQKNSINDLFIVGSGDPYFSSTHLATMVRDLKQSGIREITGDIVVDSSVFDTELYPNGWMSSDLAEGYSAPITGLSLDSNRVVFRLSSNGSPNINFFPDSTYFQVDTSSKEGFGLDAEVFSKLNGPIERDSRIEINAHAILGKPERYKSFAIANPLDFAGFVLKDELARNNILFSGSVRFDVLPKTGAIEVASHSSSLLSEAMVDLLGFSNNHATECLLKSIAVSKGHQGNFDKGAMLVKAYLAQLGVRELNTIHLVDGSGLSRYDQASAFALTDFLLKVFSDFTVSPPLIAALNVRKLQGGIVRAKTGLMSGVSNLIGYADVNGQILAFAIMTTGPALDKNPQKEIIDSILESLFAF